MAEHESTTPREIQGAVAEIAREFARDRHDRQRRRHLEPADFARLARAGFTRLGAPVRHGGAFESAPATVRAVADSLRALGAGDASVALVASMHVSVPMVCGWLAPDGPPSEVADAWEEQGRWVAEGMLRGHWWGTLTSEPGSGGDVANTRTRAVPDGGDGYTLTGEKHFGSGSGIMSFVMTTARPDGEDAPDVFVLDLRGAAGDGNHGLTRTSEWDGHGMIATQSHGFALDGVPATRVAWRGALDRGDTRTPAYVSTLFTAVIVGVVDAAVAAARERLERRGPGLGAYERVEFSQACTEAWLVDQAFEGMLRDVEGGDGSEAVLGKTAVAELSERLMGRLCRVLGGGTYARHSPFGFWFQDVRALGFLRPPWGLAYRTLTEQSLPMHPQPA